jgi:hypothetical protein
MKNIYGSDWQSHTVEIMKTLHGYENPEYDEEIKCVELETEENDKKKVLRVLVNENQEPQPIIAKTINHAMDSLEEEDIDEILIIGTRITRASRRLVNENEDLDYLTPKVTPHYRLSDLVYIAQDKTMNLCKIKCGKVPKKAGDCNGYQDGDYTCNVRRVSDDATFHAEMKWNSILHKDIDKLIAIKQQLNS